MTIKNAFDEIRAGDDLKNRTLSFIRRRRFRPARVLVPVFLALAVCAAGIWKFFTPVSVVSIDVNPSVELGINCFDRIISVSGFNDDGRRLAAKLNVRFMSSADAVDAVLKSSDIEEFIGNDETVTVSVVSLNGQSDGIARGIEECVQGRKGVSCCHPDYAEVAGAHSEGLSYGKYLAYLEAKKTCPDITAEDAEGMTMREIHELTDRGCENGSESGHHRHGHGHE